MDWQDVVASVRRLGKAASVIGDEDLLLTHKFSEVFKRQCQEGARAFIAKGGGHPVLFYRTSDCTPLMTQERHRQSCKLTRRKVIRVGGSCQEYLVQKAFLYRHCPGGEPSMHVVLTDPRPMTEGKGAWAIFSLEKEFLPSLFEMGHKGISVTHYCWDRACQQPLERIHRQNHRDIHARDPGQNRTSALLDWVVSTGCACHDGHNSLKWALHAHFENLSLLKDCHIIIASLRNAYDLIMKHLPAWVRGHVKFVDNSPRRDDCYLVWTSLSVEPDIANLLADLRLRWSGSCLEIHSDWQKDVEVYEHISYCILAVWNFRKFSDSRWLSVGTSSRSCIAACLLGLQSVLTFARRQPHNREEFIKGVDRLKPEAMHFMLMAGMISFVSQQFILSVLDDDAILNNLDGLRNTVSAEVDWLMKLPLAFWTVVASVCSVSPTTLRNEVVEGALVSAGDIYKKVFRVALQYPWKLALGDVDANLEALRQLPAPREETTLQIWTLVKIGYSRVQVVQAVRLLLKCPWSSVPVEHGHASASMLMKCHGQYSTSTLMSRALVHMMRPLFGGHGELDKAIAQARNTIHRLQATQVRRFLGRQLFFKEATALAMHTFRARGLSTLSLSGRIMSTHAQQFAQLPLDSQENYHLRAKTQQEKRQIEIDALVANQQSKLRRLRQKDEENTTSSCRFIMSTCRLSVREVVEFGRRVQSPDFSAAVVRDLRAKLLTSPPPPDVAFQRRLSAVTLVAMPQNARQHWVSAMCIHRDIFKGCAVVLSKDDEEVHLKFIYATQSPYMCCFAKLSPVHEVFEAVHPASDLGALATDHYDMHFSVDFNSFLFDRDVFFHGWQLTTVISELFMVGEHFVACNAAMTPWQAFIDALPRLPATVEVDNDEKDMFLTALGPVAEQYPWLLTFCKFYGCDQDLFTAVRARLSQRSSPEDALSETQVAVAEDDDILAVYNSLEATKRRVRESRRGAVDGQLQNHFVAERQQQQEEGGV